MQHHGVLRGHTQLPPGRTHAQHRVQMVLQRRKSMRCRAEQQIKVADQSKAEQKAKGNGASRPPDERQELQSEEQAQEVASDIKKEAEAKGEAVKVTQKGPEIEVLKESGETIYLGYSKGDYDRSRPGRVVKDDPSRYPERSTTTGGWAGGEKGLLSFIQAEQAASGASKTVMSEEDRKKAMTSEPKVMKQDGDTLYIGFEKGDFESRKQGMKGKTVKDDPRRYPDKESIGIFDNITGGFAGGEKGLQQFIEKGDVEIAESAQKGGVNILGIALLTALAGSVGGILLFDVSDFAEKALNSEAASISKVPLDDNTKLTLQAALVLLGFVVVAVGARTVLSKVAGRVTKSTLNVVKLGFFWVLVFWAAKFIAES